MPWNTSVCKKSKTGFGIIAGLALITCALLMGPDAEKSLGKETQRESSPNMVGGYEGNHCKESVIGGIITGGGAGNVAALEYSTISGGMNNEARATHATIGGGRNNRAIYMDTTIGGGSGNVAGKKDHAVPTGVDASVGGGNNNAALGTGSVIGGGHHNLAAGSMSTVPGGFENHAGGDDSLAAGHRAAVQKDHHGTFLFADKHDVAFKSISANEFAVRSSGGVRFITAIDEKGMPEAAVRIFPGSGTWATYVSPRLKRDRAPVDRKEILEKIMALTVSAWQDKMQPHSRHMDLAACDFYQAFGLGTDTDYIDPLDVAGICLAAIQELCTLVKEQADQMAIQQQKIRMLEAKLTGR